MNIWTSASKRPRLVLVTGASSGIGRAVAEAFYDHGARVLAAARSEDDLSRLREDGFVPVRLDVTDRRDQETIRQRVEALSDGEPLDVIVNNAGVGLGGPMEGIAIDQLRELFEVNVFGLLAVTQAVLPLVRRSKHGRIVMMSSISGRMTFPMAGPYAASKHALEAISDALRRELRPWRVGVTLVEPGTIATPIWQKMEAVGDRVEAAMPEETRAHYAEVIETTRSYLRTTATRAPGPELVARAVLSSRPPPRVLVGLDAHLSVALHRVLPTRTLDQVFDVAFSALRAAKR